MSFPADTVLAKTSQGQEEIATRQLGLTQRLRALLIQIDGRTNAAILMDRAISLGLDSSAVRQLVEAGLAEAIQPVTPPQAPATQVTAAVINSVSAEPALENVSADAFSQTLPRPRVPKRSLALARLHLLNLMERFLGPQSEPARAAIIAAQDYAGVLRAIDACAEVVSDMAGPERAQQLRESILELMPPPQ